MYFLSYGAGWGEIQGYLQNCKSHTKLFTVEAVELIFGNIESIYALHQKFLVNLELEFSREKLQATQIRQIFDVSI